MSEGKFATSVSCIDGRIQIPLTNWIKENYSVDYVDTITEPGDDKNIAKDSIIESIIRNKLKINSAINNAKQFLQIQEEFGSFDNYLWGFVDYKPIKNKFKKLSDLPASTEISEKLSKELKKRGFNFVGPTICYALMQAIGMVNDHTSQCFLYHK